MACFLLWQELFSLFLLLRNFLPKELLIQELLILVFSHFPVDKLHHFSFLIPCQLQVLEHFGSLP